MPTKTKPVDRFSTADEKRLETALLRGADLVDEGQHPNAALAKSAEEHGVPAGHIHLMATAYNTGQTELLRKTASDVFGRAAEFETADTPEILSIMFPDRVKSAAHIQRETVVSEEYSYPPNWTKRRREALLKKEAAEAEKARKPLSKPVPYVSEESLVKEAYAARGQLRHEVDNLRHLHEHTKDSFENTLVKLASTLLQSNSPAIAEVIEHSEIFFGESGVKAVELAEKMNGPYVKRASRNALPRLAPNVAETDSPYCLIAELLKTASEHLEASEALTAAEKAIPAKEAALLSPFAKVAARPLLYDNLGLAQSQPIPEAVSDDASETEKAAFFGVFSGVTGTTMGRELAGKFPGSQSTAQLEAKQLNKLTDPQHEQTLRSIRAESMLTDLLSNDEVIKSHPPEDVARHYNEIVQIAPRTATQEGIMRALLRRRLQQGALDQYEIDTLVKLENGLKMRDSEPRGVMSYGDPMQSGVM